MSEDIKELIARYEKHLEEVDKSVMDRIKQKYKEELFRGDIHNARMAFIEAPERREIIDEIVKLRMLIVDQSIIFDKDSLCDIKEKAP